MNVIQRLEKLRLAKGWTWEQLGDELSLSRSMLHYVRSGERDLSARSHDRLFKAERAAGLLTPADVQREQAILAETKADLSGGTLEERQKRFNDLVIHPALTQLAEMRAEIKLLLTKMTEVEKRITSEAERIVNSTAISAAQVGAKRASASAQTDPAE